MTHLNEMTFAWGRPKPSALRVRCRSGSSSSRQLLMGCYFLAMLLFCPGFSTGGGGVAQARRGGAQTAASRGGQGPHRLSLVLQGSPSHREALLRNLGRENPLQLRGGGSDGKGKSDVIYPGQVESDNLDLDSEASAKPDDLLAYHRGDLEPGEVDDLLGSEDESCGELVKKEMRKLEFEMQGRQEGQGVGTGVGGGGGGGGDDGGGEGEGGRESLAGAGMDPGQGGGEIRQQPGDSDDVWKAHESDEDFGEDGPYRTLDEVPQANASLLLEQLTLDGSIQKNQMASSRIDDNAKPERGQEVFFHYRGFCGDAEFVDSRKTEELESRPVRMMLTADQARATASSAGFFKMDKPYMGAWELCLRSLSRGEYALFLVKGAQRVGEMLGPDSPCKVPEWVPRDGSVQLRFVIELLNFGFKEVIPGGDILYKCVWDGSGYGSPGAYDEVLISFVAKEHASGVKVATSKGKRWVQLGLGVLPIGVETAIIKEFRKGAAGTVILKGRQTLRAGPEECSRALSGLRAMLDGHPEKFNWLAMCGGSLGALDWEWQEKDAEYVWGLEGKLGWSSSWDAEGKETLPCLQCDVELHDWNKIQNMSLPDPRMVGADEYASCGPLIVKNLGYREDEGTEDLQDGDEIEIEFEGGFAGLVGPPGGAADQGRCGNGSELDEAGGDEAVDGGGVGSGNTAAAAANFKRFVIGNGDLPFALDLGLTRAKSGGQVLVTMLNEGNLSWDVYRANVGRIIRTGLDMNWGERNRLAEMRKEEGNIFFKSGKVRLALSKYRFAAILTRSLNNVQVEEGENEEQDEESGAAIRALSQLNSAQCLIALGMHSMAKDECSLVLDRDPQNVKALFRRSKALQGLGEVHDALADLEKLLRLDPENAAVSRELAHVRRRVQASDAKSAPTFKKMFGGAAPANTDASASASKPFPSKPSPCSAPSPETASDSDQREGGDGPKSAREAACGPEPRPSLEEEANVAMTEFERTQDLSSIKRFLDPACDDEMPSDELERNLKQYMVIDD